MSEKSPQSRRRVLKTIGAGLSVAVLGGIGQAAASKEDRLQTVVEGGHEVRLEANRKAAKIAQKIRESENPGAKERARNYQVDAVNRAWERHLKNAGVTFGTKRMRYDFRKKGGSNGDGGFSINKVQNTDNVGLDATMSILTDDYNRYYIGMMFQLYFSYTTSGHTCYRENYGEDPFDAIGLGWNAQAWNYDSPYLSQRSENSDNLSYTDDTSSQSWFAWDVDDAAMWSEWANQADCNSGLDYNFTVGYSDPEHAAVYLVEDTVNNYSPDDTWVGGVYDHTWTGARGDVSVAVGGFPSSPGVGLTYDYETTLGNEATTTESDGDRELSVHRADATYTGNL